MYSPWIWYTWPNRLSLLRIVLAVPTALLTAAGYAEAGGVLFAVVQLTDWLDGLIAEHPGQRTEYGARKLQADGNLATFVVVTIGLVIAYWSWWWLLLLVYLLNAFVGDRFANTPGHRLERFYNFAMPAGYWVVTATYGVIYLVNAAGYNVAAAVVTVVIFLVLAAFSKWDLISEGWLNNRPFPDRFKAEYADVPGGSEHKAFPRL